jgi:hypothetical protein
MATRYRALVTGGYYSANPFDRTSPVSIRCNNPGAVNGAAWERQYPGYVDTVETSPGNKTTIFEAPEYGVAVWWELLRRYAVRDITTIAQIITQYGGGQDYSAYMSFVTHQTGFNARKKIALDDNAALLSFGKAMFHYEAGRPTPLKDEQIGYGIRLGQSKGSRELAGAAPSVAALLDNRTTMPAPAPEILPLPRGANALSLDTLEGVKAIQTILIQCGYLDPPRRRWLRPGDEMGTGQIC